MGLVNFKRLLHASVVQNEKDATYPISTFSRSEAKDLLSAPLAGGGVFGVEGHHSPEAKSLVFFAPPYYALPWEKGERDPIFTALDVHKKQMSVVQLYTKKSSMFPLHMQAEDSFWEFLQQTLPDHMGVAYQILLAYRQDNWKERVQEQYDDYLNGIEAPAEQRTFRQLQRKMNESLDSFLQWEYQHAPIAEVEEKLRENGFCYSIRLVFYGGNRHERRKMIAQVHTFLNQMSYVNEWGMNTHFTFDTIIQNIAQRKIDNVGRHQVLSVSEVLPFLMSENILHLQSPTVVDVRKTSMAENPFQLLPVGRKIKKVDGAKIAQKFIHALHELGKVKEEMVAKRTESGPTMMKVTFELPKGLKLSEINKKSVIEDIQTYMGEKNIRITQGEAVGEIDVWLPQEERQAIFLRNYVDTPEFKAFAEQNPLPFFVGVDEIGRPLFRCLNKIRHVLVAGTTGSGKSVWVNQLILTLLLVRTPEEMQFYMIDVKQVELPIYENFPHVHPVITDADEAIQLLQRLKAEMERRYTLLGEAGVKNIGLYNKKYPEHSLPYLVCVIDEYAELALRTDDVHDYVQSLAQLSRAAGIHLIIATQDPRVDVIPGIIKSNLPGKIGLRCSNANSYLTFLNTKPPFPLLGNGDGTMSFEGQMEEHIRFQGCLIVDDPNNEDKEGTLIRDIAAHFQQAEGREQELPEVVEVVEESEMDKLKRIIANTGETRVSQLREQMKININRLNELMKELAEEGWLQKPETKQSGYQLIAQEEELNNWRD